MVPRAQVRKRVNILDNKTTSKAVDALLNYETVKLFNNEQLEVRTMVYKLSTCRVRPVLLPDSAEHFSLRACRWSGRHGVCDTQR